jgi:hypothetical protein
MGERQRASRGADMLQGWLLIAKQRALRDGAPRGIRLIPPTPTPTWDRAYVTQLQYVEQPDGYRPGALTDRGNPFDAQVSIDSSQTNYDSLVLRFLPLSPSTDTVAPATQAQAMQQAYNALGGTAPDVIVEHTNAYPGQPRRVISITPDTKNNLLVIKLDQKFQNPPPQNPPPPTTNYVFYRSAQPIAGEPVLQMPRDIAIDISRDPNANSGAAQTWFRTYPQINTGSGPFDILFDKTGQVIGSSGRVANRICLWVRDVSLLDPCPPNQLPPGDNTLITIYTRSGLIAAHPVADKDPNTGANTLVPGSSWNPFAFTQEARSSGL